MCGKEPAGTAKEQHCARADEDPAIRALAKLLRQPSPDRSQDEDPSDNVGAQAGQQLHSRGEMFAASAIPTQATAIQAAAGPEQDLKRVREVNRKKQAAYRARMRDRIKEVQASINSKAALRKQFQKQNTSLLARLKCATTALDTLATDAELKAGAGCERPAGVLHVDTALVNVPEEFADATPGTNASDEDIRGKATRSETSWSHCANVGTCAVREHSSQPGASTIEGEHHKNAGSHEAPFMEGAALVPRPRTSQPSSASPAPRPLSSYAHTATVSHKDILPHLQLYRGQGSSAARSPDGAQPQISSATALNEHAVLREAIEMFERSTHSSKGVSPSQTCWFVASDYELLPGLHLSHSATLASPSCHLSSTLLLWAIMLQTSFLCHLEAERNCESLGAATGAIPDCVELEFLLKEVNQKARLQPAPHAPAAPGSPSTIMCGCGCGGTRCSSQVGGGILARRMPAMHMPSPPSDYVASKPRKDPGTLPGPGPSVPACTQKLLAADVKPAIQAELAGADTAATTCNAAGGCKQWRPVLLQRFGATVGEGSVCRASDAVTMVFDDVIAEYRKQFPQPLWHRLCTQVAAGLLSMADVAEHRLTGMHAPPPRMTPPPHQAAVPDPCSCADACSCGDDSAEHCGECNRGGMRAAPATGFLGGTGHGMPGALGFLGQVVDEGDADPWLEKARQREIARHSAKGLPGRNREASVAGVVQGPAVPASGLPGQSGEWPQQARDAADVKPAVGRGGGFSEGGDTVSEVQECPWGQLSWATVEMLRQIHAMFQAEVRRSGGGTSARVSTQEGEVMTNVELQRRSRVLWGSLAISNCMLQRHAPAMYRAMRQPSPLFMAYSERRLMKVYQYLRLTHSQKQVFAQQWHKWTRLRRCLDKDFFMALALLDASVPISPPTLPPDTAAAIAALTAGVADEVLEGAAVAQRRKSCCWGCRCAASATTPAPVVVKEEPLAEEPDAVMSDACPFGKQRTALRGCGCGAERGAAEPAARVPTLHTAQPRSDAKPVRAQPSSKTDAVPCTCTFDVQAACGCGCGRNLPVSASASQPPHLPTSVPQTSAEEESPLVALGSKSGSTATATRAAPSGGRATQQRLWDLPELEDSSTAATAASITLVSQKPKMSGRVAEGGEGEGDKVVHIGCSGAATAAAAAALEEVGGVHRRDGDMHQEYSAMGIMSSAAMTEMQLRRICPAMLEMQLHAVDVLMLFRFAAQEVAWDDLVGSIKSAGM